MKQYILFDLDGTLINPWDGITNCVKYALKKLSAPIPSDELLARFIGPPLMYSFQEYCGFSENKAAQALAFYRERFPQKGVYENFLYDGVAACLNRLAEQGRSLMIATSKPRPYAEAILRHHQIDHLFSIINGPSLNGSTITKGDVVKGCLKQAGSPSPEACVMIGDRIHDMDGAEEAGIQAIAAAYGYGSPSEFGYASYVAAAPADILSGIALLEK